MSSLRHRGEYQAIDASEGGGHGGDASPQTVHIYVKGKQSLGDSAFGCDQYFSHVSGAGEALQARAILETVGQFLGSHARAVLEPQQQAWVDIARARGRGERCSMSVILLS